MIILEKLQCIPVVIFFALPVGAWGTLRLQLDLEKTTSFADSFMGKSNHVISHFFAVL
jgi:hypothetical protein